MLTLEIRTITHLGYIKIVVYNKNCVSRPFIQLDANLDLREVAPKTKHAALAKTAGNAMARNHVLSSWQVGLTADFQARTKSAFVSVFLCHDLRLTSVGSHRTRGKGTLFRGELSL